MPASEPPALPPLLRVVADELGRAQPLTTRELAERLGRRPDLPMRRAAETHLAGHRYDTDCTLAALQRLETRGLAVRRGRPSCWSLTAVRRGGVGGS